uniref:Putative Filament-like plant protein isoform 1 n=1 Tax=Davidia involucrata TaxID=16924 RepID=A0A5B7BWN1_DAVIN
MEKRKWLWKRKSSEKSPGETESSESISSHSERYSDDQEALKASPNHHTQSPEVTSKAVVTSEEVNDRVKGLTEKLSAALVNVSAKDDLVKQHVKVAEEAVAGWEKAENELAVLEQQLEAAVQKNLALEDRVSHLDGALKECVRQLRQAREEQEQRIHEAVVEKTRDWESTKLELESQLLELQTQAEAAKTESPASVDHDLHIKLESLEKENSTLKLELLSQSEELEIRTIERDLSTQAAETASKQHLESIKKVAKLEAECRRLQAMARKSSMLNDHNSVAASSVYVDYLTDSQSNSSERLNAVETNTQKVSRLGLNECEPSCSDSWASALIAELDQFRNGKAINKNLTACSVEIDIMDDFLEMERLAALPEFKNKNHCVESEAVACQSTNGENPLRAELDAMIHRVAELEEKLEKIEAEKAELENALTASQDSLETSQVKLVELQRELIAVNESKELLEFQLIGMEVEARTMSAKVDSLKAEVEKEQSLSAEMAVKCQELEEELTRKTQEVELHQTASSNGELKIKQEDLVVAAGKLAECQKTIASLGRQLKSLATLEDFLIDTPSIPCFSGDGSLIHPRTSGELWKLHSNETFMPKSDSDPSKIPGENSGPSMNGNDGESPASSSSSTPSAMLLNHVTSAKSRNGFGKLFSRSKSTIQIENQQG